MPALVVKDSERIAPVGTNLFSTDEQFWRPIYEVAVGLGVDQVVAP